MSGPAVDSFANHIYPDWDSAMDSFFTAVDRKRSARDLSEAQAREALLIGYGDDIADAWDEWTDGAA